MTIKTRLFGKKVTGEALENLAKVFDVNLDKNFKAYDGWSATNIYAKLRTKFQENSIKLTADFHSDQVHRGSGFESDKYREGICFERIKEIPYEKLMEAKENVS